MSFSVSMFSILHASRILVRADVIISRFFPVGSAVEFNEKDARHSPSPDRSTGEGVGFLHPRKREYSSRRLSQ